MLKADYAFIGPSQWSPVPDGEIIGYCLWWEDALASRHLVIDVVVNQRPSRPIVVRICRALQPLDNHPREQPWSTNSPRAPPAPRSCGQDGRAHRARQHFSRGVSLIRASERCLEHVARCPALPCPARSAFFDAGCWKISFLQLLVIASDLRRADERPSRRWRYEDTVRLPLSACSRTKRRTGPLPYAARGFSARRRHVVRVPTGSNMRRT